MPKSEKKCDLHLHTCYSDGTLTPQELIKLVLKTKVSCVSITDHDSIKAVQEIKNKSYLDYLELIEGVELTTSYQDSEVHILGYLVDTKSKSFNEKIEEAYQVRQARFKEMVERLILKGLIIDKEVLLKAVKGIAPTRLHLAKYLLETRQVNSIYEAFRKFLGPGREGYICRSNFNSQEAIDFIHAHRGLAFLAHPHKLVDQKWIDEFLSFGIDGLEVAYPTMGSESKSFYTKYALQNKLLLSGGSDFHQKTKGFRGIGCVDVPYSWVLAMKQKKKNLVGTGRGLQ